MSVIYLLIPLSIVIATFFLLSFVWAVRSGQYEDTCTPSLRLLTEEQTAAADQERKARPGSKPVLSNNQKSNQR